MYAVIKTGGKQYRVAKGDKITVNRMNDLEAGKTFTIDSASVMMTNDGTNSLFGGSGASVTAMVLRHDRADKVIIFKKKRRHNYRRKKGHMQHQTVLEITDLVFGK